MLSQTKSIRSMIAFLLVAAATAGCGSSDTSGSPTPTAKVITTETIETDPPVTEPSITEPAATQPEITDQTAQEPQITEAVPPETSVAATDGSTATEKPDLLLDGVPTEKGTTYSIIDATSGTGFTFVSSVDGAYPFLNRGAASITLDAVGFESLMGVTALDRMRTFIEPIVDVMQIPQDSFQELTEPAAADFLGWFSGLPGVTTGPVTDTTVDGWPARSMTYTFGPNQNGLPCDATNTAGCIATIWNPAGSISVIPGGETGTLYEVVVDGSRALVDVSNRPGAQEMFETLHFLLKKE